MIDNQTDATDICRQCSMPLTQDEKASGYCRNCSGAPSPRGLLPGAAWNAVNAAPSQPNAVDPAIYEAGGPGYEAPPENFQRPESWPYPPQNYLQPSGPDNPPWGLGAGIGTWLASVAALFILPNIAVIGYIVYLNARGVRVPATREGLEKFLQSPGPVLVEVASFFVAHLITIAIIWAVVTGMGKRPFWKTLGVQWEGSALTKAGFVVGCVILMIALEILLNKILPESRETDFEKLLKTSQSVRIGMATLAILTAPLVEEGVYRGVLYSGIRKLAGVWPSVIIVTLLFGGVHFPQYWGSWAGLSSILILSFTLTVVRAKTKSIVPCILIHTLYNAVGAIGILQSGK